MAIYATENISINGSQYFLGGVVYSATYTKGFNGQPSTLEVSIIASNGVYQEPNLNFKTPYAIKIGGNGSDIPIAYNLNLYAYKYCLSDGSGGKIMTVSFQDATVLLKRKYVALKGTICDSPNIIFLGTPSEILAGINVPGDRVLSYNYEEFQLATASLGIPIIPSNAYTRITDQGTVLDVFNHFMNIYGYSWYLDGRTIRLIDVKVPINIEQGVAILKTSNRILNQNICKDISNCYIRGCVGLTLIRYLIMLS